MVRILILVLLFSTPAFAADTEANTIETDDYRLTVEDRLISLSATDAPLREILEEISSGLDIRIEAYISAEDRVTVQFEQLPLEEAIGRLSSNYMYEFDVSDGTRRLIAVIVVPGVDGLSRMDITSSGSAQSPKSTKGGETKGESAKDPAAAATSAQDESQDPNSPTFNPFKTLLDSVNND